MALKFPPGNYQIRQAVNSWNGNVYAWCSDGYIYRWDIHDQQWKQQEDQSPQLAENQRKRTVFSHYGGEDDGA